MRFTRITVNSDQIGGIPCIRGLRIPVATVVGMVADEMTAAEIRAVFPDLEPEDIRESLRYAAETVGERLPLVTVPRSFGLTMLCRPSLRGLTDAGHDAIHRLYCSGVRLPDRRPANQGDPAPGEPTTGRSRPAHGCDRHHRAVASQGSFTPDLRRSLKNTERHKWRPQFDTQIRIFSILAGQNQQEFDPVTTTLFTWGYYGWGNHTPDLVEAVDAVETSRGFQPPIFVDIRIRRSVRAAGFTGAAFEKLLGQERHRWIKSLGNKQIETRTRPGIEIADPAAA